MRNRATFLGISVGATTALAVACNQILDDGVMRWAWVPVALLLGVIALVSDDLRRRSRGEAEDAEDPGEEPSIKAGGDIDAALIGDGNTVGGTETAPRGDGGEPPRGRISAGGSIGVAVLGSGNTVAGGPDGVRDPDDR